jgi:uncharacterized membrane protein YphA (DoxX/SURF4 family)
LLLRIAVGVTAIVQGVVYLNDGGNPALRAWIPGLLLLASGVALAVGFLTPIAGVVVALGILSSTLSWFRAPAASLFETRLTTILMVTMAAAIVLLGPGALSLDARLFGRREIIIPSSARLPKF